MERLRRGKINLYYYSKGDFKSGIDWYYYFEKDLGEIQIIDYESFEKAISDNKYALNLLQKLFPKMKINHDVNSTIYDLEGTRAKITQIVELYNN